MTAADEHRHRRPRRPWTSGPTATSAPADPCAVNLAAPEIAKAVSDLPRDPRSDQPWSPEPLAGNYNECAPLSVVIVKANTNADNPNTRAVMFHLGKFIPTGRPRHLRLQRRRRHDDHRRHRGADVRQRHARACKSVVRFHWNGNGVELIGNTGGESRGSVGGLPLQWRTCSSHDAQRHLQRIRPRRRRAVRVRIAALVRRASSAGAPRCRRTTNCSPGQPSSAASTSNATSTSCAPRPTTTWPSSAGPATPSPG